MRSVSAAFRQRLSQGDHNFDVQISITTTSNQLLPGTETTYNYTTGEETVTTTTYLTNENIWENGLVIEDAVSNDNEFQIGAAIINQCTIILNNTNDQYTDYDLIGADVVVMVGWKQFEWIYMGRYHVDEADYDEGIITLTCLDYMALLDKPYIEHIAYPATLGDIVADCCNQCGIWYWNVLSGFPNDDFVVSSAPSGDNTTYRQVVSWCAQIAGQFARCDYYGYLKIGFYDFDTLNSFMTSGLDGGSFDDGTPSYTSGDTADGGSFNPWSTGTVVDGGTFTSVPEVDVISSDFSSKIAVKDTEITGVSVTAKWSGETVVAIDLYSSSSTYDVGDYVGQWVQEQQGEQQVTYKYYIYQCCVPITTAETFTESHWSRVSSVTWWAGDSGKCLVDIGNELIVDDDGLDVCRMLAQDIFPSFPSSYDTKYVFRAANINHPSDPTIEAGDVGVFIDRKGNIHPIIVSSTTFTLGGVQNTVSSASPPSRLMSSPGVRVTTPAT